MSDPLSQLADLTAIDLDSQKAEAIDCARVEGETWQAISEAMGFDDRRYSQRWLSQYRARTAANHSGFSVG